MAIILAINSGSSSVKISVYSHNDSSPTPILLADAQISGLTAPPATLSYTRGRSHIKGKPLPNITTNTSAVTHILDHFIDDTDLTSISSPNDITHACHRVVHGGDYPSAQPITPSTFHHLETLTDLAPLHNATALAIIESLTTTLPSTHQVAFFDSSFHASLSPAIRTYAIDPAIATKNQLRKYGFHGLSYAFITRSVANYLGKPQEDTNIIALHLGSGASACAIRGGKSLDTSMGLTPLAGLPGATRSGDVDPSLIFHFTHDAGQLSRSSTKDMHISQAEEILNKQSGWKAMTGTTDFGHIAANVEKDEKCRLAFEVFVDRIVGFVGSYYVKLEGRVDALVFAGGIGEKAAGLRREIGDRCRCLGFEIDEGRNGQEVKDIVQDVGREGARHRVLGCQTDEQFEMARQCVDGLL